MIDNQTKLIGIWKLMSFDSEIQQPGECQPFLGAAPGG